MLLSTTSNDTITDEDILYQTIERGIEATDKSFLFGDYLDDQKALRKMLKQHKKNMSDTDIQKLSSKLNHKKNNLITNVKKLYDFVMNKYNQNGDASLNSLMKKARKHAQKFNVDKDDARYIQLHYDHSFLKKKGVLRVSETNNDVAKQLGSLHPSFVTDGSVMNISEQDKPFLHSIHQIHAATKMDFTTSIIHNQSYEDVSPFVMNTRFNPYSPGHSLNINNFVHPALVALFAPKIESIDNRFLLSNLSSIISKKVSDKNSNTPMANRLDAALFYDMTSDPNNDLACDNKVWADLQKRCDIQAVVRYTANSLRNGNVITRIIDISHYVMEMSMILVMYGLSTN